MLQRIENATAGADTRGRSVGTSELPAMLDVDAVAAMLNCSPRHVYRLADLRRMPRPVKLGALVRWSRIAILDWIAQGCPNCQNGGGR